MDSAMPDPIDIKHSAVPLKEGVYCRYFTLYSYWLLSDKTINGQRFVVEQFGLVRTWAAPIVYGTDYIIDGVYVSSEVFDRALRLAGV